MIYSTSVRLSKAISSRVNEIEMTTDRKAYGAMKRLVIFCGGYTTIETALYLVTHNWRDRPITIVIMGTHPDLFKFFRVINERLFDGEVDVIHFESYQPRRAKTNNKIKKVFGLLPDIIGEKRYLNSFFNQNFAGLKGAEIYFSGTGFGTRAFYLLKKSYLDSAELML